MQREGNDRSCGHAWGGSEDRRYQALELFELGPLIPEGKEDNSLGLASLCETLGKLRQGTSEFWKEGPTLSLIMNVK
jgi:hypothetical protein